MSAPAPTVPDLLSRAEGCQSGWIAVTQAMIDQFGAATLDPDPMHVDPEWAAQSSPYGGTLAFGFQTIAFLTHLMHLATGSSSDAARSHAAQGHFLNYGFDRLRLVAPVHVGARIRGVFREVARRRDDRGRELTTVEATIEIEGEARPALVATWLFVWVPAGS